MVAVPPVTRRLVLIAITLGFDTGCFARTHWEPYVGSPANLPTNLERRDIVKVHLQNGEVVLADSWQVDEPGRVMSVTGMRYSVSRDSSFRQSGPIAFDSIALVEWRTREVRRPAGLTLLPLFTGLYGTVTVICTIDPKSCFGSCPTFYADNVDLDRPQAEGFSASFARALEDRDIDALPRVHPDADGRVRLTMRNEALETHAVRHVRLLALRRPPTGRVLAGTDGRYYETMPPISATACESPAGDCLAAVRAFDGRERRVPADSTDLAARETVEVRFPKRDGPLGLAIAARQAFVTTYAFYQTMAYFGNTAGEFLAALERGGDSAAAQATAMADALGGIDVSVQGKDGTWRPVGRFEEAGPIATDLAVVPLGFDGDRGSDQIRIRLSMARGNWRLDYVALTVLGNEVAPVSLEADAVMREGQPDSLAAARLHDPDRYLITFPGDAYGLTFTVPDSIGNAELFLDTKGYYYEWMRPEWADDQNLALAATALADPAALLRHLAPGFKRIESTIEEGFWSSRFGRQP